MLAGLGLAVGLSFVVTTIGSTTQGALLRWLGLDDSVWIGPVVRVVTLAIATFANLLIFLWCYARLPPKEYRAPIRPLLIGSVVAAFVFEALKSLLSLLIRGVSGSATAAVFGSTIGLMFFFNIVAQVFLMVGAWIATDVHTPGGTAPSDDEVAAAQEAAAGFGTAAGHGVAAGVGNGMTGGGMTGANGLVVPATAGGQGPGPSRARGFGGCGARGRDDHRLAGRPAVRPGRSAAEHLTRSTKWDRLDAGVEIKVPAQQGVSRERKAGLRKVDGAVDVSDRIAYCLR